MVVRLGLMGCGRIAQAAHLPAIDKTEGVELAAVMDPSPMIARGVAERYGVQAYSTHPDDLLKADVDAVLVAAPDRFHEELVDAALSAGKPVLVEKPLAARSDQAERLRDRAAETGVVLQVASMKRHDPGVRYAAEAVGTDIGTVHTFTAWYRVPVVRAAEIALFPSIIDDPGVRQVENMAKGDRVHYSLATHGAHVFDSLRYVAGEVEWLAAWHRSAGDDHVWQGQVGLVDQGIGTFQILASAHAEWQEGMDIHGTRGSVQLRTHVPFARRASNVRVYTDGSGQWREPAFAESDAYANQIAAFAAAVRDDAPPTPNAEDGLQAVRLIEAAARSWEEGRSVTL